MRALFVFGVMFPVVVGCSSAPEAAPSTAPPEAPLIPPAPAYPPGDPNEACAQIVVVSFAGAANAPEGVTRSEGEAQQRAEVLQARLVAGEDFATVARAESDAPSSRARGGGMGTYVKAEWPELHVAVRDPVFTLGIGEVGPVVRAPYGFVIPRRCAVEKVHTRHILVRFAGARNAPAEITRTEAEARALATEILSAVRAPGADFEAIARERSEDGSAERGGDIGLAGRGLLAPNYETAAFALAPGAISDVVQTDFGFHVIQRVE